jgi:hypothetical protein
MIEVFMVLLKLDLRPYGAGLYIHSPILCVPLTASGPSAPSHPGAIVQYANIDPAK